MHWKFFQLASNASTYAEFAVADPGFSQGGGETTAKVGVLT